MDPKNNKVSSEEAGTLNMKKVHVNAQVTAMTSLVEFIGNLTLIIHVAFDKSATAETFSVATHNMIFLMIVLPYAFLKNTSDNKIRIVEIGWNNVIKNLYGNSSNTVEPINNDSTDKIRRKPFENKKTKRQDNADSTKVFTTSTSQKVILSDDTVTLDQLMLHTPSNNDKFSSTSQIVGNCSYSTLNAKELEDQGKKCTIEKLMLDMKDSAEDEYTYLSYFKKLVAFSEGCTSGKFFYKQEFEDEFSCSLRHNGELRCGKSNAKRKRSKQCGMKSIGQIGNNTKSKEQDPSRGITPKLNLKGELKDKILMRKEIIHQFYTVEIEMENYNSLIERFIDLEQSFIIE